MIVPCLVFFCSVLRAGVVWISIEVDSGLRSLRRNKERRKEKFAVMNRST